jgi:uncharacterized glyoxalase superfamily protein PhnB
MDVIPTLSYRDADAAIAFLTDALGFTEHAVHRDEATGAVVHAELRFGDGMIMLGTLQPERGEFNAEIGASSVYCILDDVDGHYERAVAGGAKVVRELRDEDYGGRGYTVHDAEGNRWSFGSYRPG